MSQNPDDMRSAAGKPFSAPAAQADRMEMDMLALMPALRRYSRSLTRSEADGDDLLQDCVEKVLVNRSQWRGGSFKSWTYRIMTNLHLNRRRFARRHPVVPIDEADAIPQLQDVPDPLQNRRMMTALDALPPEQRAVLMLVIVEGYGYQEVSQILEIPIGTVMSRLSRARNALREKLRDETIIQLRRPR